MSLCQQHPGCVANDLVPHTCPLLDRTATLTLESQESEPLAQTTPVDSLLRMVDDLTKQLELVETHDQVASDDLIRHCKRANDAEKERDELRAKLAEARALADGRWRDASKAIERCVELEAKLTEGEKKWRGHAQGAGDKTSLHWHGEFAKASARAEAAEARLAAADSRAASFAKDLDKEYAAHGKTTERADYAESRSRQLEYMIAAHLEEPDVERLRTLFREWSR